MSAHIEHGEKGHGVASFLRTVRERWWLIILSMAVLGGLGYGASSLLESRYEATALLVYSARDAQAIDKALKDATGVGLPHTLSSDVIVLETSDLAERVSKTLGGSVGAEELGSSVTSSYDEERDVIYVKATASSGELAAGIADAYAEAFVNDRRDRVNKPLQSALDFLQGRIDALTPAERVSGEATTLEQYRYALNSLISSSIADYEVSKAKIPSSPYYPRPMVNLLWGLAAGLVVGLILALLSGSLDRRIKDQHTLEHVMGLPVLGSMPAPPGKQTVGFRKGNEPLLESTRMLRSNLKVLGFGETKRTILITSTAPGEGKSTLAVNLALSMALAGDRVILVDADLRNPTIDKYLGIPNTEGLGEALSDTSAAWSERIQAVEVAPFVDTRLLPSRKPDDRESLVSKFLCLTSGGLPANATELLESPALANLLADLQGYSDYVIVDGPPMLAASDSLILAQSVDAVILASTLGKQTTAEGRQVRQLLARAEIQALGLVICGAKSHGRGGGSARKS